MLLAEMIMYESSWYTQIFIEEVIQSLTNIEVKTNFY